MTYSYDFKEEIKFIVDIWNKDEYRGYLSCYETYYLCYYYFKLIKNGNVSKFDKLLLTLILIKFKLLLYSLKINVEHEDFKIYKRIRDNILSDEIKDLSVDLKIDGNKITIIEDVYEIDDNDDKMETIKAIIAYDYLCILKRISNKLKRRQEKGKKNVNERDIQRIDELLNVFEQIEFSKIIKERIENNNVKHPSSLMFRPDMYKDFYIINDNVEYNIDLSYISPLYFNDDNIFDYIHSFSKTSINWIFKDEIMEYECIECGENCENDKIEGGKIKNLKKIIISVIVLIVVMIIIIVVVMIIVNIKVFKNETFEKLRDIKINAKKVENFVKTRLRIN